MSKLQALHSLIFGDIYHQLVPVPHCTKRELSTSLGLELAGHLTILMSMQFYNIFRANIMQLCSDSCTHTKAEIQLRPTKVFCTTFMRLL